MAIERFSSVGVEQVSNIGGDAGSRPARRMASVVAAVIAVLLLAAPAAGAETWTVTGTADGGGSCSGHSCPTLRDAVEAAAAGDTIALGAGTYKLEKGKLEINDNLTIAGAGAGATTLTTTSPNQLIHLYEAELQVSGITFTGGTATAPSKNRGEGGAIDNEYGVLRVVGCAFTEDIAQHSPGGERYSDGGLGGAIYSYGKALVSGSMFGSDRAEGGSGAAGKATEEGYNEGGEGGAIYSYGDLRIETSTFSNNDAEGGAAGGAFTYASGGGEGGSIYAEVALSIAGSTFTNNVAKGGGTGSSGTKAGGYTYGGAVYNDGTATIASSSFSANTAESGADGSGTTYGYGGEGGAIYNDESLTLTGSAVNANTAGAIHYGGEGGGIYNDGLLTANQDTISGNQAPGGEGAGIYIDGVATIGQSTIASNQAASIEGNTPEGGGIYNDGYGLQLTQSTIGPANTAGDGGGIYNDDPASLTNVTIAGNTATSEGGGIYNDGVNSLANVTLYGNTAQQATGGGNLYLDYYALTLRNTLIAAGSSPTSGGNCAFDGTSGIIVSKGYNAEDSNQCTLGGSGDKLNVTLDLGPLQSNGGPTQTIALLPGSAAIDGGDPAGCIDAEGNPLSVDQRGITRPQGAHCDIGAYEYVPPAVTPISAPAPVAPAIASLKLHPSSFAPLSSGASIAKAHHGKSKAAPKGTTVSYTDSEAATTTFTVMSLKRGYRTGKSSCKAPAKHGKRPKHAKSCTRAVSVGSFTHTDVAGANSFRFSGRVAGKALGKGSYQLRATPKLGTLSGPRVSASFQIL